MNAESGLAKFGATIGIGTALSVGYTYQMPTGEQGTVSAGGVAMGGYTIVGILMPPVWTAANITFQVSCDGGATYGNLFDDNGTEIAIASPAVNNFIALANRPAYVWRGINLLKVRSGTSASPVNQAAATTVTLIARAHIL